MIIGCGSVASVAIHKNCQNSDVFTEIMIASRTVSKYDALKEKLRERQDEDHDRESGCRQRGRGWWLCGSYKPDAGVKHWHSRIRT